MSAYARAVISLMVLGGVLFFGSRGKVVPARPEASFDPGGTTEIPARWGDVGLRLVKAGVILVALPLAAGALAFKGILLEPAVAAVFMSLSTIIVAINAVLLRRREL